MEDPFFPGFWTPARPRAAAAPSMAKPPRPAKVVSIPVHFVGSHDNPVRQPRSSSTVGMARAEAASRIQSAFRGFLVRKNVAAVRALEAEIDAIEREVEGGGERLRRDGRERLRVNESLMSVIFRLDSVRGVRDCRRRAVRRAIALQEAVDAIAGELRRATGEEALGGEGLASSAITDAGGEGDLEAEDSDGASLMADEEGAAAAGDRGGEAQAPEVILQATGEETLGDEDLASSAITDAGGEGDLEAMVDDAPHANLPPSAEDTAMGKGRDAEPAMGEAPLEDLDGDQPLTGDEMLLLPNPTPSGPLSSGSDGEGGQLGSGEDTKQVMERMVKESRELKELVAQLCSRNKMQCRLMGGLLQRVDHLEKVVDRMGRRKRRQSSAHRKKAACAKKCHMKL